MAKKQFMLASYQVELSNREAFLAELLATESAYREEALITDTPILRMASQKDPEFILEIIEFVSAQAVADVMENDNVQAHWFKLSKMWKKGDFGANHIPEAHIPWALMESLN